MAHFDPHGDVAPHVRRTILAVKTVVDRVLVVSTSELTEASRSWLRAHAELLDRPNVGHDFASYRAGLEQIGLDGLTRLILLNDSAVVPLEGLQDMFARMDRRRADVWGLTPGYGFSPHLQSYFLVFGRKACESTAFRAFWDAVRTLDSRDEVITRYEVGLSTELRDAGLQLASYFRPSYYDRLVGAARVDHRAAARFLSERRWRKLAGWTKRVFAHARTPEWNVAAALADRALGSPPRLPVVKLSTLRDDPYELDASALLSACEARYPLEFDGVRDYLRRVDVFYGDRWQKAQRIEPGCVRYGVPRLASGDSYTAREACERRRAAMATGPRLGRERAPAAAPKWATAVGREHRLRFGIGDRGIRGR